MSLQSELTNSTSIQTERPVHTPNTAHCFQVFQFHAFAISQGGRKGQRRVIFISLICSQVLAHWDLETEMV